MNLDNYDKVAMKIDTKKTWTYIKGRKIRSAEIKHRKYYSILKQYNVERSEYDYFIVMLDNPTDNTKHTTYDDYNRVFISLRPIWNDCDLIHIKTDRNIDIELVHNDDSGEIYKLCL